MRTSKRGKTAFEMSFLWGWEMGVGGGEVSGFSILLSAELSPHAVAPVFLISFRTWHGKFLVPGCATQIQMISEVGVIFSEIRNCTLLRWLYPVQCYWFDNIDCFTKRHTYWHPKWIESRSLVQWLSWREPICGFPIPLVKCGCSIWLFLKPVRHSRHLASFSFYIFWFLIIKYGKFWVYLLLARSFWAFAACDWAVCA